MQYIEVSLANEYASELTDYKLSQITLNQTNSTYIKDFSEQK